MKWKEVMVMMAEARKHLYQEPLKASDLTGLSKTQKRRVNPQQWLAELSSQTQQGSRQITEFIQILKNQLKEKLVGMEIVMQLGWRKAKPVPNQVPVIRPVQGFMPSPIGPKARELILKLEKILSHPKEFWLFQSQPWRICLLPWRSLPEWIQPKPVQGLLLPKILILLGQTRRSCGVLHLFQVIILHNYNFKKDLSKSCMATICLSKVFLGEVF